MKETRNRAERGRVHSLLGVLIVGSWAALNGCSSSDAGTPADNGTGGGTGTGGSVGAGGGAGVGGGNAACGMTINDPTKYPACTCTGAHCVPQNQVPNGVATLLSTCNGGLCVPDNIIAQGQNLQLKKCTSISGAEGRCASTCIGAVANLAAYLPQDTCGADERCTPCFNPADGSPTGLCGLGCDPQPTSQPVKWDACCSGAGLCAPKSVLPQSLASQLGPETCKNSSTDVCVPAKPIQTPGYRFPCCTIQVPGGNPLAGACAPACVIDQGPAGKSLPQGSCATADEKCVPCADGSNNPTGACSDATGKPSTTCTP